MPSFTLSEFFFIQRKHTYLQSHSPWAPTLGAGLTYKSGCSHWWGERGWRGGASKMQPDSGQDLTSDGSGYDSCLFAARSGGTMKDTLVATSVVQGQR